jgi:hypothetical protein
MVSRNGSRVIPMWRLRKMVFVLSTVLAAVPAVAVSTDASRYELLTLAVEAPWPEGRPYRYPDGSVYTGSWLNGVPHGDGRLRFRNGEEFFGQFARGLPNGIGLFEDSDGNRYTGEWVDGVRQGDGIMEYANGARYEGTWSNDLRDGRGRLTFRSGARYEGGWKRDMRHGQGELRYPDGSRYSGDFALNMKHGYGAETDGSGAFYRGTFSRDQRHGKGDCGQGLSDLRLCVFNRGIRINNPKVLARAGAHTTQAEPEFVFNIGMTVLWENLTTRQKSVLRDTTVRFTRKSSLLGDQILIESRGEDSHLTATVRGYKGPGDYLLGREDFAISVEGGRVLLPAPDNTVKLSITADAGDRLQGAYSAELLLVNGVVTGDPFAIRRARFDARGE